MNKNATATILLAGMMSACAASDKDTLPITVDAPLVVPVKGTYQTFPDSEKIILTVDASSLPWNPDRLKKSEYAAIILTAKHPRAASARILTRTTASAMSAPAACTLSISKQRPPMMKSRLYPIPDA
jgi:hypothetical protein